VLASLSHHPILSYRHQTNSHTSAMTAVALIRGASFKDASAGLIRVAIILVPVSIALIAIGILGS
jgi:hypothetical protein